MLAAQHPSASGDSHMRLDVSSTRSSTCVRLARLLQLGLIPTIAAVLTLLCVPAARAIDKDDIKIHGFGGWAYALTDGNEYLIGDSEGKADNVQFSLNLTVAAHERFTIVTQVEFEQGDDDIETELDFAFVEIKLNKFLDLRLGRVKHPFGIYSEIFDVGTVRPFFLLPQSIYGPQGITSAHYDGVGLRGTHHGEAWGIEWDLYAGEFQGDIEIPGPLTGLPERLFEIARTPFEVESAIGARFNVFTPVEGLTFGASFYDGEQTVPNIGAVSYDDQPYEVFGIHFEYLTDAWSIRSELSAFEVDSGRLLEADGFYLEAAYRLTEHWQIAARYDDFEVSQLPIDLSFLPPFVPQFLTSTDTAIGINYWISPQLVIRLNFHFADGNRFAFPDNVQDAQVAIGSGMFEDKTDLLIFGAQFSF